MSSTPALSHLCFWLASLGLVWLQHLGVTVCEYVQYQVLAVEMGAGFQPRSIHTTVRLVPGGRNPKPRDDTVRVVVQKDIFESL